jgi:hypothetical protein
MTNQTGSSKDLAQHIAAALKDHPNAEVRVNPTIQAAIPEHIAKNILEFLRRVQSTGMEAIAWVEAYTHMQQYVTQQQPQPGVPFPGLPSPTPK